MRVKIASEVWPPNWRPKLPPQMSKNAGSLQLPRCGSRAEQHARAVLDADEQAALEQVGDDQRPPRRSARRPASSRTRRRRGTVSTTSRARSTRRCSSVGPAPGVTAAARSSAAAGRADGARRARSTMAPFLLRLRPRAVAAAGRRQPIGWPAGSRTPRPRCRITPVLRCIAACYLVSLAGGAAGGRVAGTWVRRHGAHASRREPARADQAGLRPRPVDRLIGELRDLARATRSAGRSRPVTSTRSSSWRLTFSQRLRRRRYRRAVLRSADPAADARGASLARAARRARLSGRARRRPQRGSRRRADLAGLAVGGDGQPRAVRGVRRRCSRIVYGFVFTAHPTFSLAVELQAHAGRRRHRSGRSGQPLDASRAASRGAAASARRPALDLAEEHAQSLR